MRVMLDTNVLISMVLFPSRRFARLLEGITRDHTLVLSSFVVDELLAVTERKFSSRKDAIDKFLSDLSFEFVYTPRKMEGNLFQIRDKNDYPVLYTALVADVDVLLTGDKDFQDIEIEKPEILTPTAFIEKYLSGNLA